MLNTSDVLETIRMIQDQNLDIRTITMGISLLDCADSNIDDACEKIYQKVTRCAKDLVKTGEALEMEYGIPIINKPRTRLKKAFLTSSRRNKHKEKSALQGLQCAFLHFTDRPRPITLSSMATASLF